MNVCLSKLVPLLRRHVDHKVPLKCFVIILYIKGIFCNVCGVVLLKSVSSLLLCVCAEEKDWEPLVNERVR